MDTASDHLVRERTPGARLISRACLWLSIIFSGLALRRYGLGLGLPTSIVKYGGSTLWGMMVFFLVAMAASHLSRRRIALISASIAVCVELSRLVHAPWLDAFRLTMAGALLLGRVFSPWDMLAYGVGIGLAMLLDRFGMPALARATLLVRRAPKRVGARSRRWLALLAHFPAGFLRGLLGGLP